VCWPNVPAESTRLYVCGTKAECVYDTIVTCNGIYLVFFFLCQADLLRLVHIEHSILGLTDLLQPGRVRNSMAY